MADAIDLWYHSATSSIRAVAIEFGGDRSTLTRCVLRGGSKSTRVSAGKALTEEQEQEQFAIVLSDSIKQHSIMGQVIDVRGAANFLCT